MAKKSLAEKVFYKIWDITQKRYVTGSREKSTWATLNGAQEKIRSMCTDSGNRYYPQTPRKPVYFEIQMFHMVQFDSMSGQEAYEAKDKKEKEAKLRQNQIEAIKKGIRDVLPGMDFYRIRECLKNGYFSDQITDFLKGEFAKINQLEKIR
jgi:hypothetical protein